MEPPQLLVQRAALATALFALVVYLVCLWWWETKSWERFVVEKEAPAWIIYGTAWERRRKKRPTRSANASPRTKR